MPHQIELRVLTKSFGRGADAIDALGPVSLDVAEGEFVSLLGPSGCGKSTLMLMIAGLLPITQGSILFAGKPVKGPQTDIGIMFQDNTLVPWRTVRGNIEFALDAAHVPKSEWPTRCERWLQAVGLASFADYFPLQLSGGMQQRASIARAFSIEPELLLMDEPFSALDEITALRMRQLLLSLWEADRRTVLFVTHNSLESVYLSDRIVVMKSGPNSRICDEIGLGHLRRPRTYDDPAQYETQRAVLATLMRYV